MSQCDETAAEPFEADLRRSLDEHLERSLPPVFGGLGVIYAFLAIVNPLHLWYSGAPATRALYVLFVWQLIVCAVFAALYLIYRRRPLPRRSGHAFGLMVALLPMVDSLAHDCVHHNPFETLPYILILVTVANIYTRPAWFYVTVALAVVGWSALAPFCFSRPQLATLGMLLVEGTSAACILFHLRLRILRRLESVRWIGEQRGAQLDAQNRRLLELDRLKSDFVSAVSHDLRTPLTSIKGFSELLEDGVGGPLNDQQAQYLFQIDRSARRLEFLVSDLLDFASVEAGTFRLKLEPVDLAERVREIAHSLAPQMREYRHVLQVDLANCPALVWADAGRIDRVLSNLLTNAAKFTPTGGQITVRLRPQAEDWRCEVEDSGPGIAAAEIPALFKRFSQLHEGREKGGTGLGLSIAKSIIDAHQGRIGVESTLGRGSTFWFSLPGAVQVTIEKAPDVSCETSDAEPAS